MEYTIRFVDSPGPPWVRIFTWPKGLECLDDIHYDGIKHDWAETRQCQPEKFLNPVGPIHGCSLVDSLINIAESGAEIQEVNSAVKPGCQQGHAYERVFGVVNPIDIKSQQLVYNTDRRMKHDFNIMAAELDAMAMGSA